MILIEISNRPEVKENKEGADTEKAAEQSAEPEELVKEKVKDWRFVLT
jgi:hypothetical protein